MSDIIENIVRFLQWQVFTHFDKEMNSGHKNMRVSHPSLNARNGLQTIELPLENYHEIARGVSERLQKNGRDVTVIYDETDGVRAFVLKK